MAPITTDEHIKLLFACIKNCKGPGQVDFNGVAADTQLTANACSKRYNKLAKEHGLSGVLRSGTGRVAGSRAKDRTEHEEGEQGDSQENSSRAKGKRGQKGGETRGKGRASKKRKMKEQESDDEAEDNDEQADYDAIDAVAGEDVVKAEPEADDDVVKAEPEAEDDEEAVA